MQERSDANNWRSRYAGVFRLGLVCLSVLSVALVAGCEAIQSNTGVQEVRAQVPMPHRLPEKRFGDGLTQSKFQVFAHRGPAAEVIPEPESPTLRNFFEALYAIETNQSVKPTRILQLGDSHTAGDRFSGRMRKLFQERFTGAGRGLLPPGVPFQAFRPLEIDLKMSGWSMTSSHLKVNGGPYGLAGFRNNATRPGAIISVASRDPDGFNRVIVTFLRQPNGGGFKVKVDGRVVHTQSTTAVEPSGAQIKVPVTDKSAVVDVLADGDGPVDLLTLAVERAETGIVYDSLGIIGTTINIIGRWDRDIVAAELADRQPALIILVFGTNEGFNDRLTREIYATDFSRNLAFLRVAAPQASIVVAGPPDANRRNANCLKAANAGVAARTANSCRSAADLSATFPGIPENNCDGQCCWYPPPALDMVRVVQRQVAASQGALFWDWSKIMGGDCGMHQWVQEGLGQLDHVHLKAEGYIKSADALFSELMNNYEKFVSKKP